MERGFVTSSSVILEPQTKWRDVAFEVPANLEIGKLYYLVLKKSAQDVNIFESEHNVYMESAAIKDEMNPFDRKTDDPTTDYLMRVLYVSQN